MNSFTLAHTYRHTYKFHGKILVRTVESERDSSQGSDWFGVSNQNGIAHEVVNEIDYIDEGGPRRSGPIPFVNQYSCNEQDYSYCFY